MGVWEARECCDIGRFGVREWDRCAGMSLGDVTRSCGGKAGKAAACTATFGVTLQGCCFRMGKTNH